MKRIISLFITVLFVFGIYAMADDTATNRFTRAEAINMMISFVRGYQNYNVGAEPFEDTADSNITYAKAIQLVYGVDNRFNPDETYSQQDFLLILKRSIDRAAPDIFYENTRVRGFRNKELVAQYARYSLNYLTAINVLRDSDDFEPSKPIDKELANMYIGRAHEAIATAQKSVAGAMPKSRYPKILLYHCVDEPQPQNIDYRYLHVNPTNFEQQIKYLSENGYTFLFPEEIFYCDYIEKSVVITFDDGRVDNYINAMPILEKYNAKATLYMISGDIGEPWYCNREQLKSMSLSGIFRVYSHTKSHPNLTRLDSDQIASEFDASNNTIYNITLRDVNSVAYPNGSYNSTVLQQAKRYYRNAMCVSKFELNNVHALKRNYVVYNDNIDSFARIVHN